MSAPALVPRNLACTLVLEQKNLWLAYLDHRFLQNGILCFCFGVFIENSLVFLNGFFGGEACGRVVNGVGQWLVERGKVEEQASEVRIGDQERRPKYQSGRHLQQMPTSEVYPSETRTKKELMEYQESSKNSSYTTRIL